MDVKVEVISRESIKPSSPTPPHLRKHQLSFLDQINPPVFMPLVFFYAADKENLDRSNHLKKSLAEALTLFYPLAGRLVDNLYVDCNDEGVPYVEARASCQLSDVIQNPLPHEHNKFLPFELDDVRDLNLAIQVNSFDCGGMAIGVASSHKVADAMSVLMFVKAWASMARGCKDIPSPRFESATLFPPKDVIGFKPSIGIVKDNILCKRFVFSASKVAALRDKFSDNKRRLTRIEALSAFIWTRFMASTQPKPDPNKMYTVLHAVNLRTRFVPPLPETYFGNISRIALAVLSMDHNREENYGVVNKMRDAISSVNGDYVEKLRDGEQHLSFIKEGGERMTKGEMVSFSFTSLCRFPIHEVDFGWGKPEWVGSASLTFKNLVVFLDTKLGDGIEAWVHLKDEDMAKFEADQELLAQVSPIPSCIC